MRPAQRAPASMRLLKVIRSRRSNTTILPRCLCRSILFNIEKLALIYGSIPKSSYYDKHYKQSPALIRARRPYLVKNMLVGGGIFAFAIGICEYIRAILWLLQTPDYLRQMHSQSAPSPKTNSRTSLSQTSQPPSPKKLRLSMQSRYKISRMVVTLENFSDYIMLRSRNEVHVA